MGGFWQEKALSKHLKKNHSSSQGILFFPCSLLFQHVGRAVNIQCQTTPLFEKRAKLDLRDLTYLYLYCVV